MFINWRVLFFHLEKSFLLFFLLLFYWIWKTKTKDILPFVVRFKNEFLNCQLLTVYTWSEILNMIRKALFVQLYFQLVFVFSPCIQIEIQKEKENRNMTIIKKQCNFLLVSSRFFHRKCETFLLLNEFLDESVNKDVYTVFFFFLEFYLVSFYRITMITIVKKDFFQKKKIFFPILKKRHFTFQIMDY